MHLHLCVCLRISICINYPSPQETTPICWTITPSILVNMSGTGPRKHHPTFLKVMKCLMRGCRGNGHVKTSTICPHQLLTTTWRNAGIFPFVLTVLGMEQTCYWPGVLFLTPVRSHADKEMEQTTKMTAISALHVPSATCRVCAAHHASFKTTKNLLPLRRSHHA